ncbi:MAG: hypothetical protein M0Z67_18855 [Nitrospiraceae bacterium]|nr:hypothetical protein [Nitrospiraceae bacterium]
MNVSVKSQVQSFDDVASKRIVSAAEGRRFPVQFSGVDARLSVPPPSQVAEKAGEIEMKIVNKNTNICREFFMDIPFYK